MAGFNLDFIHSADLSEHKNACWSKKFNSYLFTLTDSTRIDPTRFCLKFPDREPTWIFATRHNTKFYRIFAIHIQK